MNEDFFPVVDEYDQAIIMHCNAHFSGSFSSMLEYYEKEGKGAMPEFELSRIWALSSLEEEQPSTLDLMLSPAEIEEVAKARSLYEKLRSIYEENERPSPVMRAFADLVLSEEEEPEREIDALVHLGKDAVEPLIALILSEDFYKPLFPGYGYAPAAAALALGKIGDDRAVLPLFQAMGKEDFFTEAAIVDALGMLGEPARTFLLGRLRHQPVTRENSHAAIALSSFKEHPDVIACSLELLEKTALDPRSIALSTYLVINCAHTRDPEQRKRIDELAKNPSFPTELKEELRLLRS